jgi:hypothetical protein
VLNAVVASGRVQCRVVPWAPESLDLLDGVARAQMIASTLIWLAVIACGRWIAYL